MSFIRLTYFENVDIYLETSTYTLKCEHIYRIWTYIFKGEQIFQNVDINSEMWTQCQKSGQNHTKVDKILENDIIGLSKAGIR